MARAETSLGLLNTESHEEEACAAGVSKDCALGRLKHM